MEQVVLRYIVDDIDSAFTFYTEALGFDDEDHRGDTYAILSKGALHLTLSSPAHPGAVPRGESVRSSGWNRFRINVDDLDGTAELAVAKGANLASDVATYARGRLVLLSDPWGNYIELLEPTNS
jgi:predicted enzyme related to lactoylglutathione lyase